MAAAARRHALTRSWPAALTPLFDAWREAHRSGVAAPPATAPLVRVPLASAGAGVAR
jgi:hypothetical protein